MKIISLFLIGVCTIGILSPAGAVSTEAGRAATRQKMEEMGGFGRAISQGSDVVNGAYQDVTDAYNFIETLPLGTKYERVAQLFSESSAATAADLSVWLSGRIYSKDSPRLDVGTVVASETDTEGNLLVFTQTKERFDYFDDLIAENLSNLKKDMAATKLFSVQFPEAKVTKTESTVEFRMSKYGYLVARFYSESKNIEMYAIYFQDVKH